MSFTFTTPLNLETYRNRWQSSLNQSKEIITKLENSHPSTTETLDLIEQFDRLVQTQFCDASVFFNAHPSKEIRDEAEKAEQEFGKINNSFNLNNKVYNALIKVDISQLDKKEKRWVEHLLRDYRRKGVDKDEEFRNKVKDIQDQLTVIQQEFDRNINEDTRKIEIEESEMDGMPEDFVKAHPVVHGKVVITTDYPDKIPFLTYAHSESARKALTVEDQQRGFPKNTEVMIKLFSKRKELAEMLGYKSFADYRLETEMVKTGKNVEEFIDKIHGLSKDRSEKDLKELEEIKGGKIETWDSFYYKSILKKSKYAFDSQAARQYFPFNTVRDGILSSMERLFNVRFEQVEVTAWHEDVKAYHLYDNGELAGRFFLDLHPRENKYKHAAEFELRAGLPDQLPEATLMCNFVRDNELMEHGEVTTFFHEFGHLLHSLFAKQKRIGTSGISCDQDFVEAPSQMLEEWAFDRDTLKSFAKNQAGETIPDEMIEALKKSEAQGRGIFACRQMGYAAISLQYHNGQSFNSLADLDKVVTKTDLKYSPYPHLPNSHKQHAFGHLAGYSAAYYCYMWSEVIAKDIFTKFKDHGMYNQQVAQEYKAKVLGQGGSLDAEEFVKDFLGRPYSFDAFGKWLQE